MFDRKTLLVGFLSLSTMFVFNMMFRQWFDGPSAQTAAVHAGGAYKIPSQATLALPPLKTVTLDAALDKRDVELINVTAPNYTATFSTVGGTISTLSYPAYHDAAGAQLQPLVVNNFEEASFIVALNDTAPVHYKYEGQKVCDNGDTTVSFSARVDEWQIKKTFVLHAATYTIDVVLEFKNRDAHAASVRPRVFIGAPRLASLEKDKQSAVCFDPVKRTLNQIDATQRSTDAWVTPELIGVENSYFAHVLVADKNGFVQRGYFTGTESPSISAILEGAALTESADYTLSFYVGPKSLKALVAVDQRLEALLGFGWLSWFAKLLLQLLEWMYSFCHNYGVAIILSTLFLKLLLLPFSWKSASFMDEQKKLQPRVAALRKKYANDTAQFNVELMRLYKEHNISPAAPLIGCLLMIPQFPIFFAMYRVLANVVDMYQAPFVGWITDLSVKDPYYILPAIVVLLMTMQPFGAQMQSNDSRAQLMKYLMPILFAAFMVNVSAGLLLYLITNFAFSLGEQQLRKKFFA